MTVPRFIMDSTRVSVSRAGQDVRYTTPQSNIFDTRLAGVLGVLLHAEAAIPSVGQTTTIFLPRALGNISTCLAVFTIASGIPSANPLFPSPAVAMFAAGYWAIAVGSTVGVRTYWSGITASAYDQYRWVLNLQTDRVTIVQERERNGDVNGSQMTGTIRFTVFQDNIA